MVINSTNNSLSGLTSLIQDHRIQNRIRSNKPRSKKVIPFPNRRILEHDVEAANRDSMIADKLTADFTSQMYLHLLLVAGSNTLHRTRILANNA